MNWIYNFALVFSVLPTCESQRPPSFPLNANSFDPIIRGLFVRPPGRTPTVDNMIIRHYTTNFSSPTSYNIKSIKNLLADPRFDLQKPTHLYAHGYVELSADESVSTIVNAYISARAHNILLLDWANLAFGDYLTIARSFPVAGRTVGRAVYKLLRGGVPLDSIHFIGHSMGSHLLAVAARYLKAKGYKIPRLTGLDPAYPGFYTSLLPIVAQPIAPADALFVDVVHTDGGGFGAPANISHADFWPNGGQAKQPGCISATIPLTTEDFCSHWRSWAFWAESVSGGEFLSRNCRNYDSFLRGQCQNQTLVYMGLRATPNLRGNYYLRTAARSPYALGERGAS